MTFLEKVIQVEIHLFNFDEDLYDKRLRVTFIDWIREDKKFENQDALVQQIKEDVRKAKTLLDETGVSPA